MTCDCAACKRPGPAEVAEANRAFHDAAVREQRRLDLIGHGGYALLALGVLLIGQQVIWGWPLYVAGDLVWLWLGWRLGMSSIWTWQGVFLLTALHGWWSWA